MNASNAASQPRPPERRPSPGYIRQAAQSPSSNSGSRRVQQLVQTLAGGQPPKLLLPLPARLAPPWRIAVLLGLDFVLSNSSRAWS